MSSPRASSGLTGEAQALIGSVTRPAAGRLQIFAHPLVDAFFRAPPALPYLWGAAALAWLLERSTLGVVAAALQFAAGWIAWSLLEYAMHRFWFHGPWRGAKADTMLFIVHGHHHAHPQDERRLAATWWQAWSALAVLAAFHSLAFSDLEVPLAGSIAGYLAYEAVHYRIHHGEDGGRWIGALRAHHLRHHHRPEVGGPYGIGSRLFDWVFGS